MDTPSKKQKKQEKQKKPKSENEEATEQVNVSFNAEQTASKAVAGKKTKKPTEADSHQESQDFVPLAGGSAQSKQPGQSSKGSSERSNKNFYVQSEATRKMKQEKLDEFYRTNNLKIDCTCLSNTDDRSIFNPILGFDQLNISKDLALCLSGFKKPTPIQSQCWPVALSGHDTIGIAETGSGKTLAFGIPAFVHLLNHKPTDVKPGKKKNIQCLILSPTRELAIQIYEVFQKAGEPMGILTVCIYGGASKQTQKEELSQRPQVVIATPGRLIDFIKEGTINLGSVTYFVLDEADRMLDLGFEKEVEYIASLTNTDRQTIMFSATWPMGVRTLANKFLHEPVRVTVGEDDLTANHRVKQIVEIVQEEDKRGKLVQLLRKYHTNKNRVLIFALYKAEAARLLTFLQRGGYSNACAIHGDMNQAQRIESINQFKSGAKTILVATDVAARGLDIPDIEYVINVTFPLTIEDYIHRIGRTGRAGKEGVSHTFLTMQEKSKAAELVQILEQANQPVPPELAKIGGGPIIKKRKQHDMYGAHYRPDAEASAAKPSRIVFNSDDEE